MNDLILVPHARQRYSADTDSSGLIVLPMLRIPYGKPVGKGRR